MNYKKIIKKLDKIQEKCSDLSSTFDFLKKTFNNDEFNSLLSILKNYNDEIYEALDDLTFKLRKSVDETKIIPLRNTYETKGYTTELNEDNSKINIFNSDKEVIYTLNLNNLIQNIIRREKEKS